MDLPNSDDSMAAEWAILPTPKQTQIAGMFLWLRQTPAVREQDIRDTWRKVFDVIGSYPPPRAIAERETAFAAVAAPGSDPEGLAFIAKLDRSALKLVEQYRKASVGGAR